MGSVFAVREFRALWAAEALSVGGDQIARVALAVLVFDRTASPVWAAGTYALTFLPALLGGVLLGWAADRFRRREVMVVCDGAGALGTAAMAWPGLPLPGIGALLVLVVLLAAPRAAAQGAVLPRVLAGPLYERGLAVRQATQQVAQLAGFAGGGLVVAALGPPAALLIDAATFAVAASVVRLGLADQPAAPAPREGPAVARGLGVVARTPRLRALALLAWTVGWYVVPEGLAAPYAAGLGDGPAAVGLLMAADPLGSAIGALAFVRLVPARWRERLVGPVAVTAGLPLLATLLHPGLAWSAATWALSGLCSAAYLVQAQAAFVRATPPAVRGSAIGVAASGTVAAQGVAVAVGGLLAQWWDPPVAVAVCAAVGVVSAGVLTVALERGRRRDDGLPSAGPVAPARR